MLKKMADISARDVTGETRFVFKKQNTSYQEYYWWELKDKTIVAVNLDGVDENSLTIAEIEIGNPGKGVEGIANWRGQSPKRLIRSRVMLSKQKEVTVEDLPSVIRKKAQSLFLRKIIKVDELTVNEEFVIFIIVYESKGGAIQMAYYDSDGNTLPAHNKK